MENDKKVTDEHPEYKDGVWLVDEQEYNISKPKEEGGEKDVNSGRSDKG